MAQIETAQTMESDDDALYLSMLSILNSGDVERAAIESLQTRQKPRGQKRAYRTKAMTARIKARHERMERMAAKAAAARRRAKMARMAQPNETPQKRGIIQTVAAWLQ